MHWYNPVTRAMEDRAAPANDATAHLILQDRPGAVEVYDGWRRTVAIEQAMIFVGDHFRADDFHGGAPR